MTTFIDGWTSKPFPKLAFSAGGVLALADLHTIAQRTAIAGGASWFDALVLAPGIHYQQAADELFRKGGAVAITDVVDEFRGSPVTFELRNAAIAHYIQQVAKPGMTVTLNVGRLVAAKGRYKLSRSNSGLHATAWRDTVKPETGWLSHALYLTTPFITVVSITLLVIFKDWWTLLSIVTLMISRILNIWVIKRRASHTDNSKDPPQTPQSPQSPQSPPLHTSNTARGPGENSSRSNRPGRVSFSETRQRLCHCFLRVANFERKAMVHLRGKKNDLRDAISKQWLRRKTQVEDFLEGAAKLLVYLVAALSGNMTQVGSMIMMALLLTSAALLALSNAKASKMVVNGVAVEVAESQPNPATPTAPEVFGGSNNAAAGRPAHPAPPTAHSRPPDGRVVRVASDTSSSATSRYQGPARQNRSRPVVDRVGVNPESQAEMGYGGPAN